MLRAPLCGDQWNAVSFLFTCSASLWAGEERVRPRAQHLPSLMEVEGLRVCRLCFLDLPLLFRPVPGARRMV